MTKEKKMLGQSRAHAKAKTKSANPATKMNELLNGHIQKRRVKCGKPNCKCANGESHTAYYHVWHSDGQRFQKYIRHCEVDKVRHACQSYRELQINLRSGRAEHKRILARARELFRRLSK